MAKGSCAPVIRIRNLLRVARELLFKPGVHTVPARTRLKSRSHPLCSPGYPLGVFFDYSNHGTEVTIKIREKEQNWLEILASDGQIYMSLIGRDNKFLFDGQGSPILNVRNKALNFGGEYHVSQFHDALRRPQISDHHTEWSARREVRGWNFAADGRPARQIGDCQQDNCRTLGYVFYLVSMFQNQSLPTFCSHNDSVARIARCSSPSTLRASKWETDWYH